MAESILTISDTPSVSERQAEAVRAIRASLKVIRQTILAEYGKVRATIATEATGLTPQQVLDALGTAGLSLFVLGRATDTYLDACEPGLSAQVWPFPAGLTFSPELDGSGNPTGRMVATQAA